MAGEYGIERAIILPPLPVSDDSAAMHGYLRQEGESVATAYDNLARRINEFSYEQQWGSETPTQLVANQNDYQMGTAIVERFTSDASRTITGLIAPLTENIRVITNVGAQNIVLAHQSASSLAPNRIISISAADITLAANDSCLLWYDIITERWRELLSGSLGTGTGTVISVGLTMPGGLDVAGSPVTTSGTLAVTTDLDGIVKADGTDFGVIIVGTGLTYDGTTLAATGFAADSTPVFRPYMNEPPATNFATLDTRNARAVLDFDGAADEEAVFSGVLPSSYAGGGLTVSTWWSFTSATSGSLRVQAAIERVDVSSLDIDADSFASFQSAGGTAPGTNGQVIKVDVVFTDGSQMDSLAAGEPFRLKIRRDADGTSGTDNITTDAELLMARVTET